MTHEERQLRAIKFRHIRRTKWWLRRLPRRARLRRYPIIKFFAHYALRRPYLWSFRSEHVTPAIYAGFILTLLPLYGIQILLAFYSPYYCVLTYRFYSGYKSFRIRSPFFPFGLLTTRLVAFF